MAVKEYIEKNPLQNTGLKHLRLMDEAYWQLFELLDAVGYSGRMGYKDRELVRQWITCLGVPYEEATQYVRESLKNPHYNK